MVLNRPDSNGTKLFTSFSVRSDSHVQLWIMQSSSGMRGSTFYQSSVSMDNMAITDNSIKTINWIKGEFKKRFEISDLNEIKWLLGLEVNYNKDVWTLSISQGTYVNKLVECFSLESANSVSTPLEPGATLSMSQSPSMPHQITKMQDVLYKKLISSITWLALATCPNIAFSSSTLAQFMQNPRHMHWEAGKYIVHYLKGTCKYALTSLI